MRPTLRSALILASLAFALSGAHAADPKKKADLPPPPGINDPGVTTPQGAPDQDAATPSKDNAATDPLAPLPKPDTRIVRDKAARDASANSERIAASQVATRKQGTDTVEEYRQNGHVWMIRIVPQNGPAQTFMDTTGTGRLTRDPQEGPVSPVYFSLYEWN